MREREKKKRVLPQQKKIYNFMHAKKIQILEK